MKAAKVALHLADNDGGELLLLHSIYSIFKMDKVAIPPDSIIEDSKKNSRVWFAKIHQLAKSKNLMSKDHISVSNHSISSQIVESAIIRIEQRAFF